MSETSFNTLIDGPALLSLDASRLRVFDCRFNLQDPAAGFGQFQAGHIPHARYLHLEHDLSGPATPGKTGRHPLPDRDVFRRRLRAHGVRRTTQVVAYDDSGGMFAARLWWLARWAGHARVAVLDGGYPAWREALEERDRTAMANAQAPATATPPAAAPPMPNRGPPAPVSMHDVREHALAGEWTLLDARAQDRFRGANETIDPVAGHIPGALNAPFAENLGADGRFLPPSTLRERFERLLAGTEHRPVVCYCGSGVSAAHNILAMCRAGLAEPALYAGSWSEWITDAGNPIGT